MIGNYIKAGQLRGEASKLNADIAAYGNDIKINIANSVDRIKRQQDLYNNIAGAVTLGYKAVDVINNDPFDLNKDTDDIYDRFKSEMDERISDIDEGLNEKKMLEDDKKRYEMQINKYANNPATIQALGIDESLKATNNTLEINKDYYDKLTEQKTIYQNLLDNEKGFKFKSGGFWGKDKMYYQGNELDYDQIKLLDKIMDMKKDYSLYETIGGIF